MYLILIYMKKNQTKLLRSISWTSHGRWKFVATQLFKHKWSNLSLTGSLIKSAKCITKSPNVDYCHCTLPDEQIFSNYTFLGLLMELDFTDRGENVSFPGANKETNNSNELIVRRSDDDLGHFLGVNFLMQRDWQISLFYSFSFLAKLPKIFPFSRKIILQISSRGGGCRHKSVYWLQF